MSLLGTIADKLTAWWALAWVNLSPAEKGMLLLGVLGQSLFVTRWLVQLIASERAKRSVVPPLFWYFSFGGAVLVLVYAVYDANLVLIIGQFGIIIYARNLYFLWRNGPPGAVAQDGPAG